jgi:uncharacterized protein YxjI
MTEEYISAKLIVDQKGRIVPNQYYNTATKKFVVITENEISQEEESNNLFKIVDSNNVNNILTVNADGSINVQNETIKIIDSDGNELVINADGSINVQNETIKIIDTDGNELVINADGSINTLTDITNDSTRQLGEIEQIIQTVTIDKNSDYPINVESWSMYSDSAANTAETLTRVAAANKTHYITGFLVVVIGAIVGADTLVQILNGETIIWNDAIGLDSARGEKTGAIFNKPLKATENTAVHLFVGAAGPDVVTKLTLMGYTKDNI